MPDSSLLTTSLGAFFAIMNPIANTPIFISITSDEPRETQPRIALFALLTALAIVAAFTLGGEFILEFFGITVAAFRIAGGLLVGLVGFHMLQGAHSSVHWTGASADTESEDAAVGIAISPLALPVLAGPGTIVTAMNYSSGRGIWDKLVVLGAFLLICIASFVCFTQGRRLKDFLGKHVVMVVTRLMGLILAVIGAQMVIDGVSAASGA